MNGKFPESKLAHKYLDGLKGIEIGGSAHNKFGLNTLNLDFTASMETIFKLHEIKECGEAVPVDIVARGENLPFHSESIDFIVSSHALEHFPDPIKVLKEWYRVIKNKGYIFLIIPHKNRTFDKDRPRTTLKELIQRHKTGECYNCPNDHCSVWITEDVVELIMYLGWKVIEACDIDDKVGNGFTIIIKKQSNIVVKLSKVWRPILGYFKIEFS